MTGVETRLGIGGNHPPEPLDPLDAFRVSVDDLADTVGGIAAPTTPEQAADVKRILDQSRALAKGMDEQRAVEKKPHDDAVKAVQARWKPLLTRADAITDTAKAALKPWIEADQARIAAEALAAREAANAEAEIFRKARVTMDETSLEDREALAAAEAAVKAANKAAERAEKAKPTVRGDGRAVSLRTSYAPSVTDYTAFSRWAWANRPEDYRAMLDEMARKQARGVIPGVEWVETGSVA